MVTLSHGYMVKKKFNNEAMKQSSNVPQHIAIIMDGNRRWAKERGLPILAGHRRVANHVLEPLIEHAAKRGIRYVTLWAFSTENWQREAREVRGIMAIFRRALSTFGMRMHKKGIRIRVIGDILRFDDDIRKRVRDLVAVTKDNTRITVVFALNYGGRDELLRAIKILAKELTTYNSQPTTLNEKEFEKYLDTTEIPDPDIIVRTGGEKRLSGFLPWQSVYSELFFPSWYMPDFTPERLDEVIEEFSRRSRRYGR